VHLPRFVEEPGARAARADVDAEIELHGGHDTLLVGGGPMKHAWRFAILLAPFAAGAAWSAGCGGDDTTVGPGSGDGGTDSPADATLGPDGETADAADSSPPQDAGVACPEYTGSNALCTAVAKLCGRCQAEYTACKRLDLAQCDQRVALFSDAVQALDVDCTNAATCGDIDGGITACLVAKLLQVQPTATQAKVADDICACEGDAAALCAAVYFTKPDGAAGPGRLLLDYSDGVMNQIDQACPTKAAEAGAAGGDAGRIACQSAFGACALGIVNAAKIASSCGDGG
jgi:hypothetical protein